MVWTEFVHSKNYINSINVKWDDYSWWKDQMERLHHGKRLIIIFIDQSSSRSTDWFCHRWLSAYHDYHPSTTPINTSIQSNLRPVYYTNKMCNGTKVYNDEEFTPEIHGQKDVIQYAAGLIDLTKLGRCVSSRSKVFEQLQTFGKPIKHTFTPNELEILGVHLINPLNNTTQDIIHKLVWKKLKPNEKEILTARELKGKRVYTSDSDPRGGIYTVAGNFNRGISSRPGGGCQNEVYEHRNEYYWIDIALNDLYYEWEGNMAIIPKGTMYITYGIVDEETDDSSTVSSIAYQHCAKKTSMYVR